MADDDSGRGDLDRRKALKVATTCALGGGLALAVGLPVLRLLGDPAGRKTIVTPTEPLDLGPVQRFKIGGAPRKVDIVAPVVADAWSAARDVVLGAAWIRRLEGDQIEAFSAVCPHLGCAIGWVKPPDAAPASGHFLCPCHDSRFDIAGARQTGPAERGLDPLPVAIRKGRLQLTWVRYRSGGTTREPS